MSKIKLSVETPYGTATRTTERDYKYVVVSFGLSEPYLRARHAAGVRYSIKIAAKYRATAAKGGELYSWAKPGDTVYTCGQSPEEFTKWAEEAEASAAAPFVMPAAEFTVHGWSGSIHGAETMRRAAIQTGHLGVEVVPVAAGVAA